MTLPKSTKVVITPCSGIAYHVEYAGIYGSLYFPLADFHVQDILEELGRRSRLLVSNGNVIEPANVKLPCDLV